MLCVLCDFVVHKFVHLNHPFNNFEMKKITLLLLINALFLSFVTAQTSSTLKLTPAAQTRTVSKDSFEAVLKATIKNTSTKLKTIVWTRTVQTITANWTTAICDKNTCWASRINSETFTLAAGEESNLDVHCYPNGVAGAAIVNVVATDQDSATVSVIGRFGFNLPVATVDLKNAFPDIQIYPNPTPQYFTIKDDQNRVSEVAIFDDLGRQIKVFRNPNNSPLSISELASGNYFISLFNQKNEVMKVVSLVKN
jgi:hypothetical protein